MARMSIDDKLLRDPRAIRLGRVFGWRRQEAVGRLMDVFALAYDRERDVIAAADIDIAAEQEGFAKAMIDVDLGEQTRSGIRIKGAADRILYLQNKHEAARAGGIKSGETRRKKAEHKTKHRFDFGEARANPPDPVPDLPPDPVPDDLPDPPYPLARASRRKARSADPSGHELASVERVLERLAAASGVAYRGSDAHVRLIVNQLRAGVRESELRAVVAYCAEQWEAKPDMQPYLRPETLFGPQTIAKYLDHARTRYADQIARTDRELAVQPSLEVVR